MGMKEILVHVKSNEEWSGHIDHAIGLAAFFDARLRGMITFLDVAMMRDILGPNAPTVDKLVERNRLAAERVRQQFNDRAKDAGVDAVFDVAEGAASEIVIWASRLHDLTVIEQRDASGDEGGYDPAEQAALSSGRPTLIVPSRGQLRARPLHIAVAWNGSRESAAAIQAGLPFIERARRVTLFSGSERRELRRSARVPDITMASYLSRHAPEVQEERIAVPPSEVGPHLLNRAGAVGADMLIMGVYGRSWFSELVLGGATRHVLQHMTLPTLVSH